MRAAFVVVLLPLALACSRSAALPAGPPNVVLISVDTLRRDVLRADAPDAPPLPHLDALAAGSARFQRAIASASWTLPSQASLLTGLYPGRHGATDGRTQMSPDVGTLAEGLRARGYETIGFTNGGYVDTNFGFGRGFDRYDARPSSATDPEDSTFDRAAAAIVARRDERPLFLFVQTYSMHDYFRLHPWAVRRLETPPARTAREYASCLQGSGHCTAGDWRTLRGLYRAELPHLDTGLGRLRAALETAGLWEWSFVVFTADHGEGLDPGRGRIHHGGRLHEDLLRVPLWVHGPRIAGRDLDQPVSLVDVTPTLLELVGAPIPPDLDGRSFAADLRGERPAGEPRPLYASEYCFGWWDGARVQARHVLSKPRALAVIEGDRWYLWSTTGEELYDLASDPHQERDLVPLGSDSRLRRLAQAHRIARVETPRNEMGEPLRAQLEALGYVQ